MKITFLSQRQLATIVSFGLSILIEIFLMKITPDNLETIVFLVTSLFLFYVSIEVSQNFITEPIVFDLRSKEAKEIEDRDRAKNLIEGLRNNLLMQIAQGQISVKAAEQTYFNVKEFEENTNPLLLQERKELAFKEQLHKELEIGKYEKYEQYEGI